MRSIWLRFNRGSAADKRSEKFDYDDFCLMTLSLAFFVFQQEIIDAVDKVCSLLPSQYAEECKSLINMYGPKLIKALIDQVPPEKLCSSIGLCSSKLQEKLPSSTVRNNNNVYNLDLKICVFVAASKVLFFSQIRYLVALYFFLKRDFRFVKSNLKQTE